MSIDPVSHQVAMFSIPRDTVDVPIPAGPARSVFGSTYAGKINSLWTNARNRADAFPGNANSRGFNALKEVLGDLYGLDIQYFVEVNFDGFTSIVDTLGGVTINVQNPVLDDHYPGVAGASLRVYIPAGVQHMDGAQALIYARSRHTSNDFDRAQRQQRVILSIREQVDPQKVLANLSQLLGDLKTSFKTDIPQDKLPALISLSSKIDTTQIRSYVFAPPIYGSEGTDSRGYRIEPNVTKIRRTVANAFKIDPKLEQQREQIGSENGVVWVVNGSGQVGQATDVAAYLEYLGLTASAPTKRPDHDRPADDDQGLQRSRDGAPGDDRPARERVQRQGDLRDRSVGPRRHHRHHRDAHAQPDRPAGALTPGPGLRRGLRPSRSPGTRGTCRSSAGSARRAPAGC